MLVHIYKNGEFQTVLDGSFFEPSSLVGRFVASHQSGQYARLEVTRGVGADKVVDAYEIPAAE